jgi:hypothetical protein
MGIKGLWSLISADVEILSGDPSPAKVARIVDGKRIAVDLSVWMCQAENMGNPAYASKTNREHRIIKVVFERVSNNKYTIRRLNYNHFTRGEVFHQFTQKYSEPQLLDRALLLNYERIPE